MRVRGVHGKRWTKRRRGRFGRLELQEYRWGVHNAAGWPVELRKSESTSESGAVGQRGALTGVSYQDAEYASDIMTEGDEQKAAHKPWWKRLFSGFRKSKSVGEECEEAV